MLRGTHTKSRDAHNTSETTRVTLNGLIFDVRNGKPGHSHIVLNVSYAIYSTIQTHCIADASIDRLPTVSASQALQTLHARGSRAVSTGLSQLNRILSPQSPPGYNTTGGLKRGKITEIFGPSGVGKTAFG